MDNGTAIGQPKWCIFVHSFHTMCVTLNCNAAYQEK